MPKSDSIIVDLQPPVARPSVIRVDRTATAGFVLEAVSRAGAPSVLEFEEARSTRPFVLRPGERDVGNAIEIQLCRSSVRIISPGDAEGILRVTDADGLPAAYFQVESEGGMVPLFRASSWLVKPSSDTPARRLLAALDAALHGGAQRIAVTSLSAAETDAFPRWPAIHLGLVSVRPVAEANIGRSIDLKPALERAFEDSISALRPTFERHGERLANAGMGAGMCALMLDTAATGTVTASRCYRYRSGGYAGDVPLSTEVGALLIGTHLPIPFPAEVTVTFNVQLSPEA